MKRIVIFMLLMSAALFSGNACYADGIKGNIAAVDADKGTISISGITIFGGDAIIENEKEKRVKMSALAVSDYVMVKGSFDGEGGMKAIKIEKREPGGDVVEGTVDKMDIASKTLYIGDITVKMTGDTLVKEPFSLKLTLEQLMLPYYVTCEGKWTGQKEFTADKVVMD